MASLESKEIIYKRKRSISNRKKDNSNKNEDIFLENKQNNLNIENVNQIHNLSRKKNFFLSTKGIILLSVIGLAIITVVVVVVTKLSKKKKEKTIKMK